jgi:hypothetical protein
MPKATIQTQSGTTIIIEGTEAEVVHLVNIIDNLGKGALKKSVKSKALTKNRRIGTSDLLNELISENFFKNPKGLSEVKDILEVRGHFYNLNNLSTPILRKVRSRELRRIKKEGSWFYVS